jgi:hypothetical protein
MRLGERSKAEAKPKNRQNSRASKARTDQKALHRKEVSKETSTAGQRPDQTQTPENPETGWLGRRSQARY